MALWKEPAPAAQPPVTPTPKEAPPRDLHKENAPSPAPAAVPFTQARPKERDAKESVIASDLTIEGKIEGTGHVRIAGRFKGDVHVDGNVTIEVGAHVTGQVRAKS